MNDYEVRAIVDEARNTLEARLRELEGRIDDEVLARERATAELREYIRQSVTNPDD